MQKITNLEHVLIAFRGDSDGGYKGSHVQYFTRVLDDDGSEISRQPGRATTIGEAQAAGFTWPDVAAAVNAGLLLDNDAKAAQLAQLQADHAAALQAKAQAEAQRDALQAQLTALQQQTGTPSAQYIRKWQLWAGLRTDDPSGQLLAGVKAYIAALPAAVLDLWDGSAGIERTSPFLAGFKVTFGKSDADLNSMFDRYSKITQDDVLRLAGL